MGKRIVVDPVTRIEGHLRVEVEVENGIVMNAWTKGTMFRGIEQIVKGREPKDAVYITERICGVCMASHGWTSAMAVESAFGAEIPPVARVIRNLLVGALWLHDHPLHFYHLSALDYLDVLAIKNYQGSDAGLLAMKDKILKLVEVGDTAPLTPRYLPDEFSVREPDLVITALAHYIKALEIQGKAKKMSAILGGKQPHQSSIIVGGVSGYPKSEQIEQFKTILDEVVAFIKNIYVPDVVGFVKGPLLSLGRSGFGAGPGNYLAYGAFPMKDAGQEKLFKSGFVSFRQPDVQEVDLSNLSEAVTRSWYKETPPAHPWEGTTDIDLDKVDAYSFVKAPRYAGLSTEVGPLARAMVAREEPFMKLMREYSIKPGAVARHFARAQETLVIAGAMYEWLNELEQLLEPAKTSGGNWVNIHDSAHWETPKEGKGFSINEAPRGALGHWIQIEDYKIKNYQIIVPTTWNVSPRDSQGILGPIEHALIGIAVDPNNPVNIVRVIRSFDPCLACAVHLITPGSQKLIRI